MFVSVRRQLVAAPPLRNEEGAPANQKELRNALLYGLDISLNDRPRLNGVEVNLPMETCWEMYNRRVLHMRGHEKIQAWAATHNVNIPLVGVAFWHDMRAFDRKPQKLPDASYEGLISASGVAGLKVYLLGYAPVTNLPANVEACPAEEVLGWKEFLKLRRKGRRVQLLSDYARAKKLQLLGGGFFLDNDSLWLRAAPGDCALGHFFASMKKAPGFRGTKESNLERWALHYLAEQLDGLYLATPWGFAAKSPVLDDFLAKCEEQLLDADTYPVLRCPHGGARNACMAWMADCLRAWGLEQAVAKADVCTPLAYGKVRSVSALQAKKDSFQEAQAILSSALCVNNFWQSTSTLAEGESSDVHSLGSMARVAVKVPRSMDCPMACTDVRSS